MENQGKIIIKLDKLLEKSGMSKSKLSHKAEMERTQLNNYCKNNSYEMTQKNNRSSFDVFEKMLDRLSFKDNISYVTNKEIAEWMSER